MIGALDLVVVGDALLDRDVDGAAERVCPGEPALVLDERTARSRPGGAGLAAALAAADGHRVTLVSPLAADAAAAELHRLLVEWGVRLVSAGARPATPEKIRLRAGDRTLLRHDRGCRPWRATGDGVPAAVHEALAGADAVLASDYGLGTLAQPGLREALAGAAGGRPLVWDPHPAGSPPVAGARVAVPNAGEAARLSGAADGTLHAQAAALAERWGCEVVVTRGAAGALVHGRDGRADVPVARPARADACGAGDRFAGTLCAALGAGAPLLAAVRAAVEQAAGFVDRGGAASIGPPAGPAALEGPPAVELARRVRDAGGTVVAAGGCFDLLHAGHASLLRAARDLGDCLIVCLNSDASVRRLKGPSRPLVGERDRAALLEALDCVDAVLVFDEHTPRQALERLRPHVFVKGGDYAGTELAEAGVLRRWGGRVEILPFVEGRSTTRLIEEAARAG